MAFAIVPISTVGLTTVQGVSDYWVRLPPGSKPIRDIYTAGTPAVTDGKGVCINALMVHDSLVLDDCEDMAAGLLAAWRRGELRQGAA